MLISDESANLCSFARAFGICIHNIKIVINAQMQLLTGIPLCSFLRLFEQLFFDYVISTKLACAGPINIIN